MAGEVVLYTLSTCPACKRVARLLDDHGIAYRQVAVDLLDHDARSELMAQLASFARPVSFPILTAGDRVVVGHDPDRLRRALDLPALPRKGIFERFFRE